MPYYSGYWSMTPFAPEELYELSRDSDTRADTPDQSATLFQRLEYLYDQAIFSLCHALFNAILHQIPRSDSHQQHGALSEVLRCTFNALKLPVFIYRVLIDDPSMFDFNDVLSSHSGLSEAELASIPTASERPIDGCAICLEPVPDTSESGLGKEDMGFVELPCKHAMHRICISSWLKRVASCPMCRARVSSGAWETSEYS